METIEYDSSFSSSSSSQTETTERLTSSQTNHTKRKSGRKMFKETRHPVYRGVRLRNGSKWVCEVREPGKKSRIWLGTFPTPEMAARAYDAAALALHGDDSPLNFIDSAHLIRRAKSSSASDIQEAALEAALAFGPKGFDTKPSSSSPTCFHLERGVENVEVEVPGTSFVDEEVLFNMPSFYNSMAEGLVITPPGLEKGFDWSDDDFDSNIDLTLWSSTIGVCACCLRERLLSLLAAEQHVQLQIQNSDGKHINNENNPTFHCLVSPHFNSRKSDQSAGATARSEDTRRPYPLAAPPHRHIFKRLFLLLFKDGSWEKKTRNLRK
ncbi:hypothetical protein L1987_81830 [Smallanthus sonchifolius]|uniref:Uncharacterized protein n=1 Tax=Smallanthus sonchifolius TaxID=185202 RepID=A0ACB8YS60_9ASTR|nr:hypothetical protein L1987_81830 [Smallanthus sonchifolius]